MDFLSATEWLQRHAVHLLLRHGLSHFFASPVDLEQLKTQWGRSAASQSLSWFGKLSDLQLNARYLSQFTVRGVYMVTCGAQDSGYVRLLDNSACALELAGCFAKSSMFLITFCCSEIVRRGGNSCNCWDAGDCGFLLRAKPYLETLRCASARPTGRNCMPNRRQQ